MRVCHIVRQFHPSVGGLESFVMELAREQTSLGVECEVLTLDRVFNAEYSTLAPTDTAHGLPIRRVPMIGHPRFFVPLVRRETLEPFDVLHVHGIDGMFDRVARQPRRKGQALVATTHGAFFHTPFMRTAKQVYFHTVTRLAARQYDICLANSEFDRRRLAMIADDVALLPNGIRPIGDFVAEGADLLCLGRLASHKRIDRLLTVMAEPKLADATLHVVGAPWDVRISDLLQRAAELGVADRVNFHGGLNQAALQRIARSCGLFVSASQYEGFGMALIEAMSIGLVPVVEGNGSFRELIGKSRVGQITRYAEPATAAHAIRAELDALSPERRKQAVRFAGGYSWRAHAEQTLSHYQAALAKAA
ncbi:MAG TPA: glycosyltransferase family 4 protein [Vitreimonas sp.]|uniref:glycosyltransferase family 4 protein n=1 Tax=Vitreimonas sp. TaxID=3069702 RepID=UPI002D68630E|nr:glycosyltransferase family 4 protein [Vitreimonas sp.]HYD86083.1 glycosyltransferase family 4 protein [Vitreimonas sp.]